MYEEPAQQVREARARAQSRLQRAYSSVRALLEKKDQLRARHSAQLAEELRHEWQTFYEIMNEGE